MTGPIESQIVINFILNRAKNQIRTRFNRQFYLDNLIGTYGILIKRAIKSWLNWNQLKYVYHDLIVSKLNILRKVVSACITSYLSLKLQRMSTIIKDLSIACDLYHNSRNLALLHVIGYIIYLQTTSNLIWIWFQIWILSRWFDRWWETARRGVPLWQILWSYFGSESKS